MNKDTNEKIPIPNKQRVIPVMPVDQFLAWMNPEINKKLILLEQKRKRRRENIIFTVSYLIFSMIAGAICFDYHINGMSKSVSIFICSIGIFSLGLILSIPIWIKANKDNLDER